jgi:hypothetical protein
MRPALLAVENFWDGSRSSANRTSRCAHRQTVFSKIILHLQGVWCMHRRSESLWTARLAAVGLKLCCGRNPAAVRRQLANIRRPGLAANGAVVALRYPPPGSLVPVSVTTDARA